MTVRFNVRGYIVAGALAAVAAVGWAGEPADTPGPAPRVPGGAADTGGPAPATGTVGYDADTSSSDSSGTSSPTGATVAEADAGGVTLLSSGDSSCSFEVSVPKPTLRAVEGGGRKFVRLWLPGYNREGEPGAPELLVRYVNVAVPAGADVSVSVGRVSYDLRTGVTLYPAPKEVVRERYGEQTLDEVFTYDAAAYAGGPYPAKLAAVADHGIMRGYRVVAVGVYPFQYEPARGTLKLVTSVVVNVSWTGGVRRPREGYPRRPKENGIFRNIIPATVLNWEAAGAWPFAGRLPAEDGELWPTAFAGKPAMKAIVDHDGLYRLHYDALKGAGFPVDAIDPRNLRLYGGPAAQIPKDFFAAVTGLTEMPCRVAGEEDGDFGPGDYVEFYGHGCDYFEPVTPTATGCQDYRKDLFTKYNVYWLVADDAAGKRATPAAVAPAGGATPAYFWDRLHLEEDVFDIGESQPNMNYLFDEDDWLWREYTGPMASANLLTRFDVRDLRTEGPDARFKIQIRPAPSYSNGPFHSVVFLNTPDGGHKILDEEYAKYANEGPVAFEKTVPFYLMETGSNGLYFQETGGQGTTEDSVYVDFFEFEYPRRYRAYQDYLRFSNPPDVTGTVQYEITGFTTADLVLYDLTGGRRLTGFETRAEGGTYTLRFTDTVAAGQRWYVAASAAAADAAPVDLYLDAGSALRDYDENVDLLVVVYDGYYDNIQPLVDWRRAQGHRVLVARATDVYDEYACGLFDPGAIRQFVKDIYTRAVEREGGELPDSLFLVGDAWRDFRDANKKYTTYKLYRDFGMNQCPTYYVHTGPSGRTASDNFFVAMDNTSYPDLAVGRWAAPFDENVDALVDKTLTYERTAPNGSWNARAVLSADNWDKVPDGGTGAFTYDNEQLEAYYFPRGFEARKENIEWLNRRFPYVNQGDKGFDYMSRNDRKKYVAEFMKPNYKKGFDALILHYAGHGGPQAWAHENLMAHHKDVPIVDDIYDLENGPRYPIIIQCSCSTAYFDDERQPSEADPPDYGESISEYGTQAPREAAVAMLGSTRLGQEDSQARFLEEFYAYIFPDRAPRDEAVAVGEAHFAAKINAAEGLIRDCFVLLGDPALAVAAPRPGIELYPDKTSVRRGETLTVAGVVPENFNGKATVTVFDRPFYFYSRDNSENYYRDRLVAETEVEVVNGQFDATVVVPTTPATPTAPVLAGAAGGVPGAVGGGDADTASAASGTINAAGTDTPAAAAATTAEGSGVAAVGEEGLLYVKAVAYGSTFRDTYVCAETVTVGVAGDAASEDHAGPDVDVYLGDRTFRDGDPVGPTPDLIVDVRDESGVLIARNTETIGQSEELFIPLTAQVDSQAALDLTFYYQPALNDYRAGNVEKKLALAEGSHHVTVVAYDNFGNRAEKTVHCVVSGGLGLVNVMNCPNPFPKDTYFTFQATTDIDSLVIKVYTATGRLIQKIEAGGLTAGYHQIHWDGRDRAGDAIANGVYFYTIVARAGDQKTVVREKLVKLR